MLADEIGVPLLGTIPLSEELREHADNGTPLVTAEPDSPAAKAILETASRIIAQSPRDLPMIQETPAVPPAAPKLGANARELPVLQ